MTCPMGSSIFIQYLYLFISVVLLKSQIIEQIYSTLSNKHFKVESFLCMIVVVVTIVERKTRLFLLLNKLI